MAVRIGMTLIELLVVLVILAVLATVAVTLTDALVEQGRFEATQSTLQNVQNSCIGPSNAQGPDGGQTFAGFVADLGRLPQATLDVRGNVLTLQELWNPQSPVAVNFPFGLQTPAAPDNDAAVMLPCGWRGPYLRLPIGASVLFDGWGRELASPFPAIPNTGSLLDNVGNPVIHPGQPVYQAVSFGKDGLLGGAGYDADLVAPLTASGFVGTTQGTTQLSASGYAGTVQGQVAFLIHVFDKNGNEITSTVTGTLKVKIFFPYASSPPAVLAATASYPVNNLANGTGASGAASFMPGDFKTNAANILPTDAAGNLLFPAGPRVIRAYLTGSVLNSLGQPVALGFNSIPMTLTVRPGANVVPQLLIAGTLKLTS